MPTELTSMTRELHLLEQVHMALGSAHNLDDFYAVTAGLLIAPNLYGFSRVFIIRYDEKTRTFAGKMAIGARSAEEHRLFRRDQALEETVLEDQIAQAQQESPEPAAIQQLYDLRFRTLWMQLLQGREQGTGLNNSFQHFTASADDLPADHLITRASQARSAAVYSPDDTKIGGLESYIQLPVLAGRLKTRRGLNGLILVDHAFESGPLAPDLLHFQGLMNHASVWLDNVELLEESIQANNRMREFDRLKTNFLSIVSHELRTPLTSIIGFIHLLKEGRTGPVTDAQREMLTRVANHSQHLQNMVNDILEIAEVESGGMINVALQPVDPLATLWNVIPKVEARRSTRQASIDPIVQQHIPDIRTDPVALERIYYHLLDNAIKFIPQTGRVTIEFQRAGDRLEITIGDNGIGMTPENLKRIFDHFYQVDYRLERAYGGMGIGLTVVKLLLDATDGSLNIESAPNEGSRFTVSYPLVRTKGY